MYTGAYAGLRSGQAYDELKRLLLMGDLALNVRLGEERLAALIGVSRTPIREALLRLHAEGLVRRGGDGGYEPVAPDVTVISHLYEVRAALEVQALRRPGRTGAVHDRAVLEPLRDEWRDLRSEAHDGPDPSFVLLDEGFHVTLAEAAGNQVLAELLRQVNDRIRIVRMQDFLTEERIVQTIEEHLGIVDAVLSGDIGAAETRFTVHLDRSVAVVEERVHRAIARMANG
ncbi:MAG: GntR family transcriptional regulator, partial [Acidimicrobiales bacterium]